MFDDLKETDPRRYQNFMDMNRKIVEAAKQLEFELRFSNGEAISQPREIMSTENINAKLGKGPYDGVHYTNQNTGENLWQTDVYFGMTLLITEKKPEWQLENEIKIISGYRVKKATGTIKNSKGSKEKIRTIEAWYAPDISVSFGPRGFSGLPGLIIDLTVDRERYYLTEIKINPKEDIKIKKPSKGKKITHQELEEMANQAMGNMKPN